MRVPALLFLLLLPAPSLAQEGSAAKGPPPALVVTAPAETETVRSSLTLVGSAEPRFEAAVAAEAEGLVETLAARKGEKVGKGEPLVALRTRPVELQRQEARARLEEIKARQEKAGSDLRRARELFAERFISEEELQQKRTELDALERQADQARAVIRLLEDRLARMTVRAPFAGRVVEERTEVGQWLAEGDPAVVLADLSVMHIMVPVPEQRIAALAPGDRVEVRFDALPGRSFPGTVSAVVPRADPATRTFPVQVSVENPEGRILAGMLARVDFPLGEPAAALLVPKDALVPEPEGGGYVVKVEAGKAVPVTVRVTGSHGHRYAVEATDGELRAGDKVVVRGNERLRLGQEVRESVPGPESRVPGPKTGERRLATRDPGPEPWV